MKKILVKGRQFINEDGDPVVFPVSKGADSESLMQEIDRILSELRESGKLRELSLRYFGEDLTNP